MDCPECDLMLDLDEEELDVGDEFYCPECGCTFEVIGIDPIQSALMTDAEGNEYLL